MCQPWVFRYLIWATQQILRPCLAKFLRSAYTAIQLGNGIQASIFFENLTDNLPSRQLFEL